MFKCRICGGTWTEIPPDAVEIAARRRGALYQFGGTVHDLRQHKPMSMEEHKHKHRKTPRQDCRFCNPILAAEQALLQEVQPPVQAPVPEPIVEEKPELAEIEDELSAITTLAAAFRRANRDSR